MKKLISFVSALAIIMSCTACGGRGRGFKSRHSDHFKSPYLRRLQGIVNGVIFI